LFNPRPFVCYPYFSSQDKSEVMHDRKRKNCCEKKKQEKKKENKKEKKNREREKRATILLKQLSSSLRVLVLKVNSHCFESMFCASIPHVNN
jgi:hypothetical protein